MNGADSMFKEPAQNPMDTSGAPSLGPIFAASAFPYGVGSLGNTTATPVFSVLHIYAIRVWPPRLPTLCGVMRVL